MFQYIIFLINEGILVILVIYWTIFSAANQENFNFNLIQSSDISQVYQICDQLIKTFMKKNKLRAFQWVISID